MPRTSSATGPDPEVIRTAQFFGAIVPAFLEAQPDLARGLAGRLAFRVLGEGGGDWTVDLDAPAVHAALREPFEVFVELAVDDFEAMLTGAADLVELLDEGRVRLAGDPTALRKLSALLSPS